MAEKEQIAADVVMESVTNIHVKKGTFVQRAGLQLAAGVGFLITVITIITIVFFCLHYPSMPSPDQLQNAQANSKVVIDNYKQMSEIAVKNTQDLFQTIVMQALLPVFTAILGYIFAKGEKQES